uniref:Uncharacterized protein n=1 Tax=Trichobilharzia regenti TaxID=157069 RepID=A0AA85IXB1_TRIRE|nr:unnamed protein product [Trichobilharzia regenti]
MNQNLGAHVRQSISYRLLYYCRSSSKVDFHNSTLLKNRVVHQIGESATRNPSGRQRPANQPTINHQPTHMSKEMKMDRTHTLRPLSGGVSLLVVEWNSE